MFTAKVLEITSAPNKWKTVRVGVYSDDVLVGEYNRNYGLMRTFFPFQQDGKWYALYSSHYMYTRVMSLPDCVDLGGESAYNSPYEKHFCPMEYLVPELFGRYSKSEATYPGAAWDNENKCFTEKYKLWDAANPIVSEFAKWGLVAGCSWGDDSSSKVEFLDLTEVSKGVIKRERRFGYLELGYGCNLKENVDVNSTYADSSIEKVCIEFPVPKRFYADGKEQVD